MKVLACERPCLSKYSDTEGLFEKAQRHCNCTRRLGAKRSRSAGEGGGCLDFILGRR